MDEIRAAVTPRFSWTTRWWAIGGNFPLIPIARIRQPDQWNTRSFFFQWLWFKFWTMDSPSIGVSAHIDDYQACLRVELPYCIIGIFHPWPRFVSRNHWLWRKPRGMRADEKDT